MIHVLESRRGNRDAGDGRLVISSSSTVDDVGNLRSPYLVAAGVYLVVVGLAVNGLARVFKAFSPQMLTPLGVIFGLIVGFVALQTWNDFDKAKVAVDTEASALRVVVVLDESLPEEQRIHLRTLINRHIDEAVNR